MCLGLELDIWMCLRFQAGYLEVESLRQVFGGFFRRCVATHTELKMCKCPLKCGPWALEAGFCTTLQSHGDVGT